MKLARTLSGRLFLLTIAIVMATEVLVFLPSIARFREDFLMQRLQMAQIASLALLAADDAMVEEALERELLANAGVSTIVLRRDSARQLILRTPLDQPVAGTYDLREATVFDLIGDALAALARSEDRLIRLIGEPVLDAGEVIEITLAERALRRAMWGYSQRIFFLSLIISAVTGALVFLVCRLLIVRPMQRVVGNMVAFQNDPENARATSTGSSIEEIARAETALADMQGQIRAALKQKTRLAELGLAVAKISHDLRNMLSSAQLMADRLEGSRDPIVRRVAPKLIGSIDRAVNLCVSTLKRGKAEETPPEPRRVALRALADEVGEAVFADDEARFENLIDEDAEAVVDPEHLFRILQNLTRNAAQAMAASGRGDRVTLKLDREGGEARILVSDNGPGIPARALDTLFQPFSGSGNGSGLGLAIAAELARANGGALRLADSTTQGTSFELVLPAQAPDFRLAKPAPRR